MCLPLLYWSLDSGQACSFQTVTVSVVVIGSIIFTSLTALIRYTFVRTSFKPEIQNVLKRDFFCVKLIVLGECLLVLHAFSISRAKDPWPMFHACLNPTGFKKINIIEIEPSDQFIIHIYHAITIFCNIFVWYYLKEEMKSNIAIQPKDRKLNRKRNLVPAKIGFIHLSCYGFIMIFGFFFLRSDADNATKLFSVAFITDFMFCILSPLINISLGSHEARLRVRKLYKLITKKCSNNDQ